MGASKPCLGYPSRTAAVAALRSQGKSSHHIAAVIGISVKTVAALARDAERSREPRTDRPAPAAHLLSQSLLLQLRPHAARRGLSVDSLVRLIIMTVVDEEMIDAVLDDVAEMRRAS